MSNKMLTIMGFFLAISALVHGQDYTQTIKGRVTDQQSHFPLPGVTVILLGSDPVNGTVTDMDGYFRLENVPVGRQAIQVSFIGYETRNLANLVITSGKELNTNVELQEQVEQLEELVITANDGRKANNKMATVSARSFSIEEANRYSGSFQDPSRMAQNYAGVAGASDDRNDIIIRGNSPLGVLWRMEGIDIPSPNHFATLGNTGGPVSMLNINNLSNSDFMTGAWSADYGNATSGVFDLKLRNGNSDKTEFLGQVGFNGFEAGVEGPFRKGYRGSYLLNYRYSMLAVVNALGIDFGTGSSIPYYQDLNMKINLPTKKMGTFTLFGLGGLSNIEFGYDTSNVENNLYAADNTESFFESNTGIIGGSHSIFLDKNTSSKLVIAMSGTQTKGGIDSINPLDQELIRYRQLGFDRRQYKLSAHYKLSRKFSAKDNGSIGIMYDHYNVDILDSIRGAGDVFRTISDIEDQADLVQAYALWQHKFNDRLTLNSGIHSQHFLYSSSNTIEPRLGLKFAIRPNQNLSLGYGIHSQIQPITVYFVEETDANGDIALPNKNIDFTKTMHYVLGYDWFISNDIRLKTEVYYQNLYNIPVENESSSFSMINSGADFAIPTNTDLSNTGTGYNYGLEITLEKFFSKGYYFLFTSSLFDSKYKGSDGVERNTLFNSNYVTNALAGYEFDLDSKGKNTLSFNTKITYAGGRRYTPINLEQSRLFGAEIREDDKAFSAQFDPYFRADFKVMIQRNGKKISQQFSIDFQNLTNQQNIFLFQYNRWTGEIQTTYQRGFFPDVQYKIFF